MAISTPPPSSAPAAPVVGNAPPLQKLGEVVVEAVPERLQLLSRTAYLTGIVVPPAPPAEGEAAVAANILILRTQVGEITIRATTPLPLDRLLTIQIPPGAPPVRAQVYVTPLPGDPLLPAMPSVAAPITTAPLPVTPTAPPLGAAVTAPPTAAPAQTLLPSAVATIEAAPLLPGMIIRAEVLAAPTLLNEMISHFRAASPLAPQTDDAVNTLQATPKPLASFNPAQLADVMRQLPPDILLAGEVHTPALPVTPRTLSAAGLPPLPDFALTPALLTFPPGSKVIVQVEEILPPQDDTAPVPNSTTVSRPTAPAAMQPQTSLPMDVAPEGKPLVVPAPLPASAPITPPMSEEPAAPLPQPAAPLPPRASPVQSAPNSPQVPVNPVPDEAPAPNAPRLIPAQIIGQTPSGAAMATSPAGLIILPDTAQLPVGTRVMLNVMEVQEPRFASKSDIAELPPRHWPVLQEAVAMLNVVHPAAHAAVLPRLPQPTNLGPMTLLFMAALKLGDVNSWLGSARDRVQEASGADLLGRITGEFGQQARASEVPSPEGWRTLTLPLPPEGQLAQLVIHNRKENDPDNSAESGQHLIVELELSRLGPMQLDGFIRRQNFDLLLRTQSTLPRALREELRTSFQSTLEAVGYRGGLNFETAAQLWLKK